ncbi:MAG: hypothetical protein AAGB48_03850 [Planctomycetota bacterium]
MWFLALMMTAAVVFASGVLTGQAIESGRSYADDRIRLVMHTHDDEGSVAGVNPAVPAQADQGSSEIDSEYMEAGRQIAFATLFSQHHEVTQTQVTFFRDSRKPGNAIQQFGQIFGEAIARQENPTPRTSPLNGGDRAR